MQLKKRKSKEFKDFDDFKETNFLKKINWKLLLIITGIAVLLQDIILERLIPLIFMNNTTDANFTIFLFSTQLLIYAFFGFYLYKKAEEYKFLNAVLLSLTAAILSSLLYFIIQSIISMQPGSIILIALINLIVVFYLLFATAVGALVAQIHSKLDPEVKYYRMLKFCFVLGILTSLFTFVLNWILQSYYALFVFAPASLFNSVPVVLSLFLFRIGGSDPFGTPLPYILIYVLYYFLFFFFVGLFYIKARHDEKKALWILLLVLLILIHLVCAAFILLLFVLGGA